MCLPFGSAHRELGKETENLKLGNCPMNNPDLFIIFNDSTKRGFWIMIFNKIRLNYIMTALLSFFLSNCNIALADSTAVDTNPMNKNSSKNEEFIKGEWGLDKCEDFSDIDCMSKFGWDFKEELLINVKNELKGATVKRFIEERNNFLNMYKDGDKIYIFTSPPKTWENLMGRQGYMIFRSDSCIATIITLLN
jgi:hypothetical protein